jgi:hypothetical protein
MWLSVVCPLRAAQYVGDDWPLPIRLELSGVIIEERPPVLASGAVTSAFRDYLGGPCFIVVAAPEPLRLEQAVISCRIDVTAPIPKPQGPRDKNVASSI